MSKERILSARRLFLKYAMKLNGVALLISTPSEVNNVLAEKRSQFKEVSVKDFGAKGDGATNDTKAFQAALAAARKIYIPEGSYIISETLNFSNHQIIGAGADYTGAGILNKGTLLTVVGDINCFKYNGSFAENCLIQGMFIDFGATLPVIEPYANKIGVNIPGGGHWPSFFEFKDLRIRGASIGINDTEGSFMCKYSRIHTQYCRIGFYKNTGTTQIYENCHASFGNQAYVITNAISVNFIGCSFDQNIDSTGKPIFYAKQVRALSINGMDQEGNRITTADNAIMLIDNCKGFTINSMANVSNEIANTIGEASWMKITSGSVGSISGVDSDTLLYNANGNSGKVIISICLVDNTTVKFTGCNFPAINQLTKITEAYSIVNRGTGMVTYENCIITNSTLGLFVS